MYVHNYDMMYASYNLIALLPFKCIYKGGEINFLHLHGSILFFLLPRLTTSHDFSDKVACYKIGHRKLLKFFEMSGSFIGVQGISLSQYVLLHIESFRRSECLLILLAAKYIHERIFVTARRKRENHTA